jgi:hypothetical protein
MRIWLRIKLPEKNSLPSYKKLRNVSYSNATMTPSTRNGCMKLMPYLPRSRYRKGF